MSNFKFIRSIKLYLCKQQKRNVSKSTQKKIIVSVTNDLVSDNRVHKVCTTLTNIGFSVLLVGRKLPKSLPVNKRSYPIKRFRLCFNTGVLFYAEYNFRLFLFLLFSRFDVLLSNDLDSLTANFLAAKLKNKPIVYDSHEYFTEVPELIGRPQVKRVWERLERAMLPKIESAYTVCNSIARVYQEKYGVDFKVVRNIPLAANNSLQKKKIGNEEKIILYQGAVNIGRGLKEAILAMHFIENARLLIVGDGDIRAELEALVAGEHLQKKVEFKGRLSINELEKFTPQADLGLSIEEDLGLNYRYALPNKLFDYIRAQVPVLVTKLPEMVAIVSQYKIGLITDSLEPERLAEKIKTALNDAAQRIIWEENLRVAASKLTWEKEEKVLKEIFGRFL